MYAVTYDMGLCPASWDFLNWLKNVEIERNINAPGQQISVRFVAGPQNGFRADNMPRPLDARRAIFEHVIKPSLQLANAVEGHEDNAKSPSYTPRTAVEYARRSIEIPHWTIPPHIAAEVTDYLAGRCPVVITLRETNYWPERNSNLENWTQFARNIGVDVIFVRDTSKADEPLEGFVTCARASKDLLFRAGLMAQARLNMMVANGPIAIAQYLPTPWVSFKPLTPTLPDYGPGQPKFWDMMGIGVCGQWPWSAEDQRICWGDDTLQILETAWAGVNGLPDPHPIKPLGQIVTKGAYSDDQRYEHSVANVAKVKNRVVELGPHPGTAIIACYGPSLKQTWEATRHERNLIPGAKLITVSGAHDFLIERRIKPNYHIDCDPRPHKHEMVTKLQRKTEYLLASCVHPSYVDKLKGHNVTLWHLANGDESNRILDELEPNGFLIGGGGSAGLRAICVMYAMGFRKFILHGMDCSFDEDSKEQHAGPHGGKVQHLLRVKAGERWFWTSTVLVSYAQQFLDMLKLMMAAPRRVDRPAFDFHGDGLLQEMLRVAISADLQRKQDDADYERTHRIGSPAGERNSAASAVL